ncbi:MAG TPA: hypothetical protein VGC42_09815 [Kofleriaceae bacterium]
MPDWYLLGGLAAGAAYLASRSPLRRRQQQSAANAAGLAPVADLSHLPSSLQRSALWAMAEGGFESRVVHGVLPRGASDIDVTAFDLETLRERRGEWAYLPVVPPFRIGGTVSIVVCEVSRAFPHVLFKRAGRGDQLEGDDAVARATSIAKLARGGLGLASSYPSELPRALPTAPLAIELPAQWRAYGDRTTAQALLAGGVGAVLERAGRRDLVVEVIDQLVIVYPAARDVIGADAFGDLTTTALAITDGILAGSRKASPRGIEAAEP